MSYKDSRGFTDSLDNQKDFNEKYFDKNPGPFIATVKYTEDPLRMGRLGVNIPALTHTTTPTAGQITWCQYLSPFYGVKPLQSVKGDNPFDYKSSQTSYGMWAIPPDIDTTVLVIFAKGDSGKPEAFWIGCVQEPNTNAQIPGHASSPNSALPAANADFSESKQDRYGTDILPVGEKNRQPPTNGTDSELTQLKFPVNERLADQLLKQGLGADTVRGTTTSSAQREAPSAVFGITTPGRIRPDSQKPPIGLNGTKVATDRDHGHSFVMDDGAADGTNQLARIRTSSGHQLLMNDSEGIVYIANATGNAWLEMDRDGRIDIYSGVGGINMRTQGDFNLHSDANINMHASGQVRMSAKNEIIKSAGTYMLNLGEKGILNSSQKGSVRNYARDGISSFTDGTQLHGAGGRIDLAGSQVHFNSVVASSTWGPGWLTPEAAGISERQEGDVELAGKGQRPLKPFTKQTPTTVHRFVTHEPMPRLQGFSTVGALPFGGPDKVKEWYRVAYVPGTVEYTEQRNRLSPIESIRLGQFQADSEAWLKEQMGTSTDGSKARDILVEFGKEYDKAFDIEAKAKGKWNTAHSISNKLKGFDVSDSVSEVLNNQTKKLANQVIDTVTGSQVADLFKDNVFVNQSGELFALGSGQTYVETVTNKAVSKFKTGDLTSVSGINVSGITGNIPIENIASIGDMQAVTNVYKNVLSGQVTSSISSTAISAVKSRASGFFAGLSGSTTREIGLQGLQGGSFTNIGVKIGAMALPKIFGGGTIGSAVSAIGSFFSDSRLKEDIRLIGKSPAGINIYSFKYYQIPGRYIGVMAQEVPWARHMTDSGYWAVDYSKVDVEFRRLH